MALFRRNKVDTSENPPMPPELTDYYNSERRERTWRSVLLLLVTLFVTIIILFAVFLAGRWGYRKFVKKDQPTPTITINDQKDNGRVKVENSGSGGTVTPGNSSGNNQNVSVANNNQSNQSRPASGSTAGSSSGSNSSSSSTSSSTSNDGKGAQSTTNLADTGPGDVVLVFGIAAAAGALAHSLRAKKRA